MSIDFKKIRAINGSQKDGFEEFVCHIARNNDKVPAGSKYERYRGAGGDGGVECIWKLPDGKELAWQAKYFFSIDKKQLDKSVRAALKVHPEITRYFIAIPFNLTGKTARKGLSEIEKFEKYVVEWTELAKKNGMDVSFELLNETILIEELTRIDIKGGKQHFWFEKDFLSEEWFNNHLDDALKEAGPRYTPKLNIETSITDAFEAFGKTGRWKEMVYKKVYKLDEVTGHWDNCLHYGDWNGDEDFPKKAQKEGESLYKELKQIQDGLVKLFPDGLSIDEINSLKEHAKKIISLANICRDFARLAIESKHGKGKQDSEGWKQFMSEYMASFPTRHYDTSKEIADITYDILSWLDSPMLLLSASPTFLLTGAQGIGKTHSICDVAVDRNNMGFKSIILFGHQFSDDELWVQIRKLVGLDHLSREQFLEALDEAGETSGKPLVIFIDALNETHQRDLWKRRLSSFMKQVERYKWIKLCISCRTIFEEEIIPEQLNILKINHFGFEGVEFDACFEFFDFYDLDPPSMLLIQPEYFNPLFLKLMCQSLNESGYSHLPSGILGFSQVVDFVFIAKNKTLSEKLDYSEKEHRIQKAMAILVDMMCRTNQNWIEWDTAKNLIEGEWPCAKWSNSFFNHLLIEGLIKEDRVYDYKTEKVENAISIGFERLGDHLITSKHLGDLNDIVALKKAIAIGGSLHFLFKDSNSVHENKNLIEAFATYIPEKYGVELNEIVKEDPRIINEAMVRSLQWRESGSITKTLIDFFEETIMSKETKSFYRVADALLSVSTIENHPLNAKWLHDIFLKLNLIERDGLLSPYLHLTFEKYKSVDRLIRWGLKADLSGISKDTILLWMLVLCWFTSSSNRKVRDSATKALIRIGSFSPSIWSAVIKMFSEVDDDYVVERCLASAYGSLLRNPDRKSLDIISKLVASLFFGKEPRYQNALIIDYARLIIELSKHRGLGKQIEIEKCIPPYSGNSTIEWPDEKSIDLYKEKYWELPKLYHSCMADDFQHYTVPSVIRKYEEDGVGVLPACRWIFKHVLDMGYIADSKVAEFDKYILSKHGGGRSRPEWIERIGKKYQWIALYRLAAKLAIKYPEKENDMELHSEVSSLLESPERNIDVSIIIKKSMTAPKSSSWWAPIEYKHKNSKLINDEEWLKTIDFPDDKKMFFPNDEWIVLDTNFTWEKRNEESKEGYPYRQMWMHLRSLLINKSDIDKCWKWIQKQNFMNDWMPSGYRDMSYGFWGEYPWATPFNFIYEEEGDSYWAKEKKIPCKLIPTSNDININFSFDAYQPDTINPSLPSQIFFANTRLFWNAVDGYTDDSGKKIFFDPAMTEAGPHALLVRKDYIVEYLKKHNLALIWTTLSEKMIIPGNMTQGPGYTMYSRAFLWDGDNDFKLNKPFVEIVIHKKKEKKKIDSTI